MATQEKQKEREAFLCIGTFSGTEGSHSVEYVVQYWGKFLCRLLMPFNKKVGKVQSCKKTAPVSQRDQVKIFLN